jgi:hypothetical protein
MTSGSYLFIQADWCNEAALQLQACQGNKPKENDQPCRSIGCGVAIPVCLQTADRHENFSGIMMPQCSSIHEG